MNGHLRAMGAIGPTAACRDQVTCAPGWLGTAGDAYAGRSGETPAQRATHSPEVAGSRLRLESAVVRPPSRTRPEVVVRLRSSQRWHSWDLGSCVDPNLAGRNERDRSVHRTRVTSDAGCAAAGNRVALLRRMWGSREALTDDVAGPLLEVFRAFLPAAKKTSDAYPVDGHGVVLGPK